MVVGFLFPKYGLSKPQKSRYRGGACTFRTVTPAYHHDTTARILNTHLYAEIDIQKPNLSY